MWTLLFLSEVSFITTTAIFQLWLLFFFPQYSSLSKCVSFSMKWLQVNNLLSQHRGSQHANVKPLKLISRGVESKLFGSCQLYINSCMGAAARDCSSLESDTTAQTSFDIDQHPSILSWFQMSISHNTLHEHYINWYMNFFYKEN